MKPKRCKRRLRHHICDTRPSVSTSK
jgi:hypothetical protein